MLDDWEFLIRRPGWSASDTRDPFHEHLVAAPAPIYKTLQATFGMTSVMPYYVVAMTVFAIAAGLLFAFLRVRVGGWLAFAAILPVLLLGASSEDLLWAFQVGYFGSVAAGIGTLLALDREDRRGDLIASVLAVVALFFGSLGIPFVLALAVDVAMGPRPRRDRAFVAAVPIGVYVIWWIGWGHQAQHHRASPISPTCRNTCSIRWVPGSRRSWDRNRTAAPTPATRPCFFARSQRWRRSGSWPR